MSALLGSNSEPYVLDTLFCSAPWRNMLTIYLKSAYSMKYTVALLTF